MIKYLIKKSVSVERACRALGAVMLHPGVKRLLRGELICCTPETAERIHPL